MSLFQTVSKVKVILWKRINFQQIKDLTLKNVQSCLFYFLNICMIFVYNIYLEIFLS